MSKTIGARSTANAACGSSTATVWRTAPAGIRTPAASPTARSDGPPVSSTRSVSMTPRSVSTAVTRDPPLWVGVVRRPVKVVRSRSSTPAACIASE